MEIGLNYPWLHCGWDFGPEVHGWGTRAAWKSVLPGELPRLRGAGVRVLRWFLLADGIVLGTGPDAPARDRLGRFRMRDVPALSPAFVDDFAALLGLLAAHDMQLLPSLIDFSFAFPGLDRRTIRRSTLRRFGTTRASAARLPAGYVKGGRADVLLNPTLRARFLACVLEPLLVRAREHARAIYAFELINEPEWVTRASLADRVRTHARPVSLHALATYVRDGATLIGRYGFESTVGFVRPDTERTWESKFGPLGLTRGQYHYYPRPGEPLAPAPLVSGHPTILGEFATRGTCGETTPDLPLVARPWPELPIAQQLAMRLAHAEACGYRLALPWSLHARDGATHPDPAAVLEALRAYKTYSSPQALPSSR